MHHIFGGPFLDQETADAFGDIHNTPHLMVDIGVYRERYANRFIELLECSGYRAWRVNPLIPVLCSNGAKISVPDMLYPPESPKPLPKWEWDTNTSKNKRTPYFSHLF